MVCCSHDASFFFGLVPFCVVEATREAEDRQGKPDFTDAFPGRARIEDSQN